MKADSWFLLFALCLFCLTSNGLNVGVQLGSSVFLPCNSIKSSEVKWVQINEVDDGVAVVEFTSDGLLRFLGPRHGRVKAFALQASQGNYSIRIDDLRPTDLGVYICHFRDTFLKVELFEDKGAGSDYIRLSLYICFGVVLICILASYRFLKRTGCTNNRTQDANPPVRAGGGRMQSP